MSLYAAVSIITIENKEVLILKRAINPLDPWSGHLSLPGGRIEKGEGPFEAALRETEEECGIKLDENDFCQELEVEYAGHQSFKVVPYHFNLSRKPTINLAPDEHSDYFWVNFSYLKEANHHRQDKLSKDFPNDLFPYITVGDTPLWGFTYNVLRTFLNW